jgi:hypothetical protein
MNAKNTIEIAHYFGLEVEVIYRLENASLICYQGRESIVDTTDLCLFRYLVCGLKILLAQPWVRGESCPPYSASIYAGDCSVSKRFFGNCGPRASGVTLIVEVGMGVSVLVGAVLSNRSMKREAYVYSRP